MGRKKLYHKRFSIGLNEVQAHTLEAMSNLMACSYSDVVSYLIVQYQLGSIQAPTK